MRIFLSYAREDQQAVESLYDQLAAAGYEPWMDVRDLIPGQNWELEIQKQIISCDLAIVFLSRVGVGKVGYVQTEQGKFIEQLERRPENSIYLIPARLDDCPIPTRLSKIQATDLFATNGLHNLIRAVAAAATRQSASQGSGQEHEPFIVFTRSLEERWDGLPGYEAKLTFPELSSVSREAVCKEVNPLLIEPSLTKLHRLRSNTRRQDPDFWRDMPLIAKNEEHLSFRISALNANIISLVFDNYW